MATHAGGSFGSDTMDIYEGRRVEHVESATLRQAVITLLLGVLGAGQLTLPYAFSQLGLFGGLAFLGFFGILSIHSLHTLSVYQIHFTPEPGVCLESYVELVVRIFGQPLKHVISGLIALYAWGGGVSFLVIIKGELKYIAERAGWANAPGEWLMIAVAGAIVFPLGSLSDVSGLKRFSPLGCTAAVFIMCVVVACAHWDSNLEHCEGPGGTEEESMGSFRLWPIGFMELSSSLPLISFALNSSWAYVPILCTLKEKTPTRVASLVMWGNGVILLNYSLLATFGYSTYCEQTKPNILESLAKYLKPGTFQFYLAFCAHIALPIQLTLALPMRFMVARKTLMGGDRPPLQRILGALALVGSAATLAALPVELNTAIGLTSAICASMIIYILPSAVDLRTGLPGTARKVVSAVSVFAGFYVMIFGVIGNIEGTTKGG